MINIGSLVVVKSTTKTHNYVKIYDSCPENHGYYSAAWIQNGTLGLIIGAGTGKFYLMHVGNQNTFWEIFWVNKKNIILI